MKLSKVFVFAAGSIFFVRFLRDGTLGRLVDDGTKVTKDLIRGARPLTR